MGSAKWRMTSSMASSTAEAMRHELAANASTQASLSAHLDAGARTRVSAKPNTSRAIRRSKIRSSSQPPTARRADTCSLTAIRYGRTNSPGRPNSSDGREADDGGSKQIADGWAWASAVEQHGPAQGAAIVGGRRSGPRPAATSSSAGPQCSIRNSAQSKPAGRNASRSTSQRPTASRPHGHPFPPVSSDRLGLPGRNSGPGIQEKLNLS